MTNSKARAGTSRRRAAYCGAKHAIQGFTESLPCELRHDGSHIRLTMVQLPALNTPQFGWVKSRLPHKAQLVPPICQPEVAAEAILWAAYHDRRELNVGLSTSVAILASKLVPGLADRYLARTGYESQQTGVPEDPDHPHNLWQPVPGDHGAHGDFGDRAYASSPHLWATTNRGWLALAGVGIVGLLTALMRSPLSNDEAVPIRRADDAGVDAIRGSVGDSRWRPVLLCGAIGGGRE